MNDIQDINDWKQSPNGLRWNWFLKVLQDQSVDLNTIPFPHATKIEYQVYSYFVEQTSRFPDIKYTYHEEPIGKTVIDSDGDLWGYSKDIETNSSYLDLMFQIESLMSRVHDWQHCCVNSGFSYHKDTRTIEFSLSS